MNIKELRMAAKKLQIDPGFYCLSGKAADRIPTITALPGTRENGRSTIAIGTART
ncbi:MAG: hypothetical protein II038_12955 [Lachnospiraceae bacterium]|nr:hypothetical protein [Lachnospiraceae bacterium]